MVNNKNSIKIKQLNNNLKDILDEFKKLNFNSKENVNSFLQNIIEKFKYIKPILSKATATKRGNCKKCNIFKGGASSADLDVMNQQEGVCFICLEGSITNNRRQTNELLQDRGIVRHHAEPGNCQIIAHENCWQDLFQNMDTFRCPGCHKSLELRNNEVVISNVPMLNNDHNDNFVDDERVADELNLVINNNEQVNNNDMIYNSLILALLFTYIKLHNINNNSLMFIILSFSHAYFINLLNINYLRNPNPPLEIITLGYMTIPFFVLQIAILTIDSIAILGGPHLVHDTYRYINEITQKGINNPEFNKLINHVLNNNTNMIDIEGGYKKTTKKKGSGKTKKNTPSSNNKKPKKNLPAITSSKRTKGVKVGCTPGKCTISGGKNKTKKR